MAGLSTFEQLLAEGTAAPVEGWDFSWFTARATEQRPSWGYTGMLGDRLAEAGHVLDIQTGGGEILADALGQAPRRPGRLTATEGWPPNVEIARRTLEPFGANVIEVADAAALPFPAGSFDLVVSRHPTVVRWQEIARVLAPGGTYLSQQIGSGSHAELRAFLTGEPAAGPAAPAPRTATPQTAAPQTAAPDRRSEVAAAAGAAGLEVVQVRHQALRTVFYDVGAVVAFLRKVVWTVPGFTVAAYQDRLAALHAHICAEGHFVSYTHRLLVEARRPGPAGV